MTEMTPGDRTYRNQLIRISDHSVTSDVVQGVTFEGCHIVGPAVIALLGTTSMMNSSLSGDLDATIWPVPASRQYVVGAIALVDCTIASCRLERIGLAVPEDQIENVRRGFGSGDPNLS